MDFNIEINVPIDQTRSVEAVMNFGGEAPLEFQVQLMKKLDPAWQFVPDRASRGLSYLFKIFDGNELVGHLDAANTLSIKLSSYSNENVFRMINVLNRELLPSNSSPICCRVHMFNKDRSSDDSHSFQQGLKISPECQLTTMLTEFAVMSHAGLASLKQWPARRDGKEVESSVCYFERNRRERAAISVATGPKGQYIFFTSVQSTMQAELEKLFGLKLKRVKVKKG